MKNGNKINLSFTNSEARNTQTSAVLNWLQSRKGLTRWDAMVELGIGDLEGMIKSVKQQLDTVNRRSIIQESDMDVREADLDAIERQLDVMERLMKDNPVIEITE